MGPDWGSMLRRGKPVGDATYWLVSDELGRDMISRLMLGSRLSLFMGVTPVLIAFVRSEAHTGELSPLGS